jgi:tRNA (guanine-N7-)-methyltransferase
LQNTSTQHTKIETFSETDAAKEGESSNEFKPTLGQLNEMHAGYVERPAYRPVTKFENRGIKLGHGVWDLVYKKV